MRKRILLLFRTEVLRLFLFQIKGTAEYTLLVFSVIRDILDFLRGQQSWATEFKK